MTLSNSKTAGGEELGAGWKTVRAFQHTTGNDWIGYYYPDV